MDPGIHLNGLLPTARHYHPQALRVQCLCLLGPLECGSKPGCALADAWGPITGSSPHSSPSLRSNPSGVGLRAPRLLAVSEVASPRLHSPGRLGPGTGEAQAFISGTFQSLSSQPLLPTTHPINPREPFSVVRLGAGLPIMPSAVSAPRPFCFLSPKPFIFHCLLFHIPSLRP